MTRIARAKRASPFHSSPKRRGTREERKGRRRGEALSDLGAAGNIWIFLLKLLDFLYFLGEIFGSFWIFVGIVLDFLKEIFGFFLDFWEKKETILDFIGIFNRFFREFVDFVRKCVTDMWPGGVAARPENIVRKILRKFVVQEKCSKHR